MSGVAGDSIPCHKILSLLDIKYSQVVNCLLCFKITNNNNNIMVAYSLMLGNDLGPTNHNYVCIDLLFAWTIGCSWALVVGPFSI